MGIKNGKSHKKYQVHNLCTLNVRFVYKRLTNDARNKKGQIMSIDIVLNSNEIAYIRTFDIAVLI